MAPAAPPRLVEAEVFALLPEAPRKSGVSSERLETQLPGARPGGPRRSFLKDPAFGRDGSLCCVAGQELRFWLS